MASQTFLDSALEKVARTLAAARPRVLVLSAAPGYHKTAVIERYGRTVGRLMSCHLVHQDSSLADISRAIVDALVQGDAIRTMRSAADRLAQRPQVAASGAREVLRREWQTIRDPELFALFDRVGVLGTLHGADLCAELLVAAPATRAIALASRTPLPPVLHHAAERGQALFLGAKDLSFSAETTEALAFESGLSATDARVIYDLSEGWPLAAELLIYLRREGERKEVLDTARTVPHPERLTFAAHRAIIGVSALARDAIISTVILSSATQVDLIRILGDTCDDAVFSTLSRIPFVTVRDGSFTVHPAVSALIRSRFATLFNTCYERTLRVLTGDGAYTTAATIALECDDSARAAAILDGAPPYTAAPVPIAAYERIIDRLNPALITQFPKIWIATIPFRSLSVEAQSHVREAETVYYCLPPGTSDDQRAAALMILASAYVNVGRLEDADALLNEALLGFAAERTTARAAVLNFAASLRGIEGRFALARSLASEAARISPDSFGQNQVLLYIDCHEAAYRGKQDRVVVIIDELLRRRKTEGLPLYVAYAAVSGAIFSWTGGDDVSFQRYLAELEDAITPGLEAGLVPIVNAARGRPPELREDTAWPAISAMTLIYHSAAGSGEHAVKAARRAAAHADRRRDPYLQLLSHATLFLIDEPSRTDEAAMLLRIVHDIESSELKEAVARLIRGEPAGMLQSFVSRHLGNAPAAVQDRIAIELLSGRLLRNESEVRLTDKEFELILLLASSHGVLSLERVGDALWEHLDPDEWRNNVKVTIYRIRKKLGSHDVILARAGTFRTSPELDVDLRRAEAAIRNAPKDRLDEGTRSHFRSILSSYRSAAVARYDRYTWGGQLIARVSDVVSAAGTLLAIDAVRRGDIDEALDVAERVRNIDATNERACETIMRIMISRGNVDAARREYHRFATLLAKDFGTQPAQYLTNLVRTM